MNQKLLVVALLGLVATADLAIPTDVVAQTQGMDRRDDGRDAKQACRAGDDSRAECRQEKRDEKYDGNDESEDDESEDETEEETEEETEKE